MAFTFFGLLYLQIEYLQESIRMRNDKFDEDVKRSLYQISRNLGSVQTKKYLYQELMKDPDKNAYKNPLSKNSPVRKEVVTQHSIKVNHNGTGAINVDITSSVKSTASPIFKAPLQKGNNAIARMSYDMQEEYKKRVLYESNILSEVISEIINTASNEPMHERINFRQLENDIRGELKHNGIELPFQYEVVNKNNKPIYRPAGVIEQKNSSGYPQVIFPNDPP